MNDDAQPDSINRSETADDAIVSPLADDQNAQPAKPADLQLLAQQLGAVREQIHRVIVGQERVIDQILIALLCGGHAILQGVPGTAKTLLVRTLAQALSCRMKRVQFTPDLMPTDIVGTNIYNLNTQNFELRKGPIFTDLLLADEINRAPAKTQSALLEAMSERHATIDGERHLLSSVFCVFATQNPIEFEGTYPLPEAQQDRFLLKIMVDYPTLESERQVLMEIDQGRPPEAIESRQVQAVLTTQMLVQIQSQLSQVRVEPGVLEYILSIVRSTRLHDSLLMGAGPRGSINLLLASKAQALLNGRDFVTPDDIAAMVSPVLGHRVVLAAEAEISGESAASVLQSILDQTEVPR